MTKMTSLQRLMTASMGKEPDRVPVAGPFTIDWAWRQLYGENSFADIGQDSERLANCMVFLCKEVGIDGITAFYNAHSVLEGLLKQNGISEGTLRWENFVPTDTPEIYKGDPLHENAYGNSIINSKELALRLKPADPYKDPYTVELLKAIEITNKRLNGEYSISGSVGALVGILGAGMGWTPMFMAIERKDPRYYDTYRIFTDVAWQSMCNYGAALLKAGCTGLGSHTELPQKMGAEAFLANPDCVRLEIELHVRLVQELQKIHPFGYGIHLCSVGSIENGMDAWKKLVEGLGGVLNFSVAEYGGADMLLKFKEALAPASVTGNLHPVNTLAFGTPSEVEDACVDLIKKCGPGGRFILAPGCGLPLNTPFENVRAIVLAADKHGTYPIKM